MCIFSLYFFNKLKKIIDEKRRAKKDLQRRVRNRFAPQGVQSYEDHTFDCLAVIEEMKGNFEEFCCFMILLFVFLLCLFFVRSDDLQERREKGNANRWKREAEDAKVSIFLFFLL